MTHNDLKLRRVTQQLLIVPTVKHWLPRVLGVGSVVGLPFNGQTPPNPLGMHEPAVTYADEAGRALVGYVRQGATAFLSDKLEGTQALSTLPCDPSTPLAPVDALREIIAKSRMPARIWLVEKGSKRPKLLRRVVRELGGNGKKDDASQLVIRLTRMLFKEDGPMARQTAVAEEETDNTEARPAKKSRKAASNGSEKEVSRKAAREPEAEGRHTQAQSAGEALLAIKGVTGTVLKQAKKLSEGEELSKKQLTELRDAINAAAAEARENDEGKTASAYSAANKIVRRLQRAA